MLPENASEAEVRQLVRNWLATEPDFAWFSQYNARNARSYAIAADEAHKAGFVIFGHTDDAPGSVRDGMDIIEHIWGFGEAVMSPDEMRAFREGKFATWATFLAGSSKLDGLIADAVRRGAALNPTLQYEWGGMSRRRSSASSRTIAFFSNPDLSYMPRNVVDGILGRQRQIKNFSTRYENTPWIVRLSADDRKDMETGFRNVLDFTKKYVAAGGKVHAGTDTIAGGVPGLSIHHEMEILVEAGLSPMQALKAATSWPAELLEGKNGARGRAKIGSLRPGNFADLVVVSADPLSDISNTKKIERVMKNGRWVELGYHPEYFTQNAPCPADRRVIRRADHQRDRAQPRDGRRTIDARGAGGKRVRDDLARPGRRNLGQDDLPRPEAAGVRSSGERSRRARRPTGSVRRGRRRTSG